MKNRLKVILVALTATLSLMACGEKEEIQKDPVRPIKAMQVGQAEAFGGRWFPGQASAAEIVNLSFRVSGTMHEFPVLIGEKVKKGQLVARLDPRPFQVSVYNAEANLKKATADRDLAQADYQRVMRVYQKDPGAVSKSMVDKMKSDLDAQKAQVESARASLAAARDNLSYSYLKAPFDGTVVDKFVENFEDVQAKQEILRLVDNSEIKFTIQVPETLMAHADKVERALVVFDAYPDVEVPALITEIGKEASRTTRTFPVVLRMGQPEGITILPGMAGKARGDRETAKEIAREMGVVGVEIPISATFADEGGKTFVWKIDEQTKKVHKKEVTVVNLTEQGAMVTGLEPGVWIATAGVNTLVEDQQVRLVQ